ncbi:hypothetical protein OGR47_02845 [Methylocystis sp. MJC1]|uniref:hypothetical protein n=1 Tax=Methylocystis sp. MJC1 TaxID=2654282 RepID=UPI0013EB9C63|nr:hypothetical protein [Methylocystis sp. MJC1]KAF2991126.1 hypothetical protein MJC1_01859 [Methylocystis sp. MJC1]MBU6525951.1 hypothetical protein [Methylocystis sp. MJC1]UZX12418.1 hypothetical protein OGR47_02845 [Methylocystis sp. MJC1]
MSVRAPIRQHDLTRAIRALAAAGMPVAAVRLDASGATILTSVTPGALLSAGDGLGGAMAETTADAALARLDALDAAETHGKHQDTLLPG